MRSTIRNAALIALATLTLVSCEAAASARQPAPRTNVTLRCPSLAEDSAANVRLVEYDPQPDGSVRIVYRCKRFGY